MQSSTLGHRPIDATARLALEAERNPEWRPWLELLGLTAAEASADGWSSVRVAPSQRAPGEPWLHHATVVVDTRLAGGWMRRLLEAATSPADRFDRAATMSIERVLARDVDPLVLLSAAVRQDVTDLARLADLPPGDCAALASVSQLAAVPLLLTCARAASDALALRDWNHGWCPVCAAWPAFAELRGLDRTRNLRCGRCAADWAFSVLRCPFCDERDHRALGALLPGDDQPTRRVETCRSCSGYLKSFTVLRATPSWAIPLEDLSSVPLDLAAHERGFARPERRALRLEIALRAAAPPMAAS